MKRQPFKIDEKLVKLLRKRKERTGELICWQVETAIRDFLNKEK